MLNALILTLLTGAAEAGPDTIIHCEFPARSAREEAIHVRVAPYPSLRDRPGLFRVTMEMNDIYRLAASVQPIGTTDEHDVMIRTKGNAPTLAIGLRDDGRAALSVQAENGDANRDGDCQGHSGYLQRWLSL